MTPDGTVADIIRSCGSVYAVYPMDRDVSRKVAADEISLRSPGSIIDNCAMKDIIPKRRKYCVFSEGFLGSTVDRLVVWVDGKHGICGHGVTPAMRDKLSRDAVWVSDTFVIYPEKISDGPVKTVFLPYPIASLRERGFGDAVAYNPSVATDMYLRRRFGFDGPSTAMSTIVAFDS